MSKMNTSDDPGSVSNVGEAANSSVPAAGPPDNKATERTSAVVPETTIAVLERLARQVEYYFSAENLERDTYVATLRSLNDGYVPLSIIANFGKVRSLVSSDALNAVRRAAMDCSELLEVVHIDTRTGKRLDDETVATSPEVQTVEAVGPRSGEPIPTGSIAQIPISPSVIKPISSAPVQNTLIIREVPEVADESQIRDLFAFEKCPAVLSLHLDVANCWFVTLDTQSKDEMINVMFELRSKKFPSGESVKARLKSAVVMNADVLPANALHMQPDSFTLFAPQLQDMQQQPGNRKLNSNRKKKKNGTNPSNASKNTGVHGRNGNVTKSSNSNSSNNNANLQRRNNTSNIGQKKNTKKNTSSRHDNNGSEVLTQTPPTMGEDQFPLLFSSDINDNKKVEVEKVPEYLPEDDLEKPSGGSDSASTATTTSSSSSSKNASPSSQLIGGYAAALLKEAPPVKSKPTRNEAPRKVEPRKESGSKRGVRNETAELKVKKECSQANPTSAKPKSKVAPTPMWGGGRSFADVLRKEAAAAVAVASPRHLS